MISEYILQGINSRHLPRFFQQGVNLVHDPQQQDMLFLSLLTVVSYALPNLTFSFGYPTRVYHPNLMVLVRTNKYTKTGVMYLALYVIKKIKQEKERMMVNHATALALAGQFVPKKTVMVPRNSSSEALFRTLHENEEKALMLETDMSVLSTIWKHDFANYSFALNHAFKHATITAAKKKGEEQPMEITEPQLSILYAGDKEQLELLTEGRENNLASRFACYFAEAEVGTQAINLPDDMEVARATDTLNQLSNQLYELYHFLLEQDQPCHFELNKQQNIQLYGRFFTSNASDKNVLNLAEWPSVAKRKVVIALRIASILSMMKWWEQNESKPDNKRYLPTTLTCDDNTFQILLSIADTLVLHAQRVSGALAIVQENTSAKKKNDLDTKEDILRHLQMNFTTADLTEIGDKLELGKRKMDKLLKEMIEDALVAKYKKGVYRKL